MRKTVRDGWRFAVEMIDSSRVKTSRTGRCVFIKQRQHALVDHVFLAAKAAADRAHDEAHLGDRLRNDARQHVAVMRDVLVG